MVYNATIKGYLDKYRENNREKINKYLSEYRKKRYAEDEDYRKAKMEESREYVMNRYNSDEEHRKEKLIQMKQYRDKKRQEKIDAGIEVKPRGRPRKVKETIVKA